VVAPGRINMKHGMSQIESVVFHEGFIDTNATGSCRHMRLSVLNNRIIRIICRDLSSFLGMVFADYLIIERNLDCSASLRDPWRAIAEALPFGA